MTDDRPVRLTVERLRVTLAGSDADVVDDVSFSLEAGHTLGLVGESGSGKTTVALALLGYARRGLEIDSGRVLVDGSDVLGLSAEKLRALRGQRVAYVPQDPLSALNPALKLKTQLREVLQKSKRDANAQRLSEVLAEVRLEDPALLDTYPHQLSGGQQQRVALAMAFVLRPAVIVLDEPTTGLDVTTQRHVLDTIGELCATHGVAGIFVSHDLAVIGELTDHVAVMYAGRIVERGPKASIFGAPAHPYTRGLLRAVPSPERSHVLVGLEGQPPRPGARPAGCFFAPRCTFVQDRCTVALPPMIAVGSDGHGARCVRATELIGRAGGQEEREAISPRAASERSLLKVSALRASYGQTEILHDLSFELSEQECLAIVGESGSGKTTLARCISGLHERWSGQASLRAEALERSARARRPELLRALQYIFQNPYGSLNPRKRVADIIAQPLERFFKLDARECTRRVVTALEDASLDADFRGRYPSELSGGERQRVAIARALVVEPEILLCDEISSALDVSVQAAIVEQLRRLQSERGLALVFITHNLALVRAIAQRVIVMQAGSIVEQGETETVLEQPQAPYTQRLLRDLPRPYVSTAPSVRA